MYELLRDVLVTKIKVRYPANLTPETTRQQAGLDSLAIVELSMILERDLNLPVTDDDLFQAETLGDMAALMEAASKRSGRE
jgi:acyl carrier protein